MGVEAAAFRHSRSEPRRFAHPAIANARRESSAMTAACASACPPWAPCGFIVKIGALDARCRWGARRSVFWTKDKPNVHLLPQTAKIFRDGRVDNAVAYGQRSLSKPQARKPPRSQVSQHRLNADENPD